MESADVSYRSFYRNIYAEHGKYWLIKNGERYIDCKTLPEALYERDRFENVGWDWDKYVQLAHTINGYLHIDLPPFAHQSEHIAHCREHWLVRGKGSRQKYYGAYYNHDEALKIAKMYNANITHIKDTYRVQKNINGERRYFGNYRNLEDARKRVKELMECDWNE